MSMPEVGSAAPPFKGVTQDGSTVSLDDFKGQRVALYFYPRDNTKGCTAQACNLRDNLDALGEAGIQVVGVSDDPQASHESFASKYDLPFPLIADTEHEVLEAYGVWAEKNMYGKKFWGTKRTTFLIGKDGTIKDVIKRPKTGQHAEEILERFGA